MPHFLSSVECGEGEATFFCRGTGVSNPAPVPGPAGMLLRQQLEVLESLKTRISEDEMALKKMLETSPELDLVRSLPGMGPI
jgi:hypothetical protein